VFPVPTSWLILSSRISSGHGELPGGVVWRRTANLVGSRLNRQPLPLEDAEHVLEAAAHEEDLLAQAQLFALLHSRFMGLEPPSEERFRTHLLQNRPGVVRRRL